MNQYEKRGKIIQVTKSLRPNGFRPRHKGFWGNIQNKWKSMKKRNLCFWPEEWIKKKQREEEITIIDPTKFASHAFMRIHHIAFPSNCRRNEWEPWKIGASRKRFWWWTEKILARPITKYCIINSTFIFKTRYRGLNPGTYLRIYLRLGTHV